MSTRATRPEYYYVHPAVEPAGVELNWFELNGIDLTGMQGYADIFAVPADQEPWALLPEGPPFAVADADDDAKAKVPKIEPHDNPPWITPPDRFQ